MRKGWEVKRLEECFRLKSGDNLTSKMMSEDGVYPVFGGNGIAGLHNEYNLSGSNVIIGRVGALCGNVRHMNEDIWLTDNAFKIVEFKYDFDHSFLTYLLNFKNLREHARQAAQPVISNSSLKDIVLEFPKKVSEQQRIVSILDEAFAAIATAKANAEQNLKNAKELFESYLQGVFENKDEGWEDTILKKEIELITGFAFKSKGYTDSEDDILLLRGDNIMQGYLRLEDVKRWKKSEYHIYEKYQLQVGDILLAMDRPWVTAGLKHVRVPKDVLPALLLQRTACLRNKTKLDNSFLLYLVKSKKFMNYLIDIQTGIGVPHISGSQILDFSFSLPNMKEQKKIVKKLDALSTETKKLEAIYQQKIADLEELKKSILQKAFNGELKYNKESVL